MVSIKSMQDAHTHTRKDRQSVFPSPYQAYAGGQKALALHVFAFTQCTCPNQKYHIYM